MVTQAYLHSIVGLMLWAVETGLAIQLETLGRESLITRGRNALVARFLDLAETTHLLFVDSDIGFAPEAALRLLDFDVDVAAGMYPLKTLEWDALAVARARAGELISTAPLRYVGKPCEGEALERREGFITAEYAGTGFMLIRRQALLRMIEAYPELRYAASHETSEAPSPNLHALFDCVIDPVTRHYLSEDYTFCQRWRALGGRIWLDTRSRLTHLGAHEFAGEPAARFAESDGAMRPPYG